MLIPTIFQRPRKNAPNARGRRSRAGFCLELETLENRTALSSGLGTAVDTSVLPQVSRIEDFVAVRMIALEQATLEDESVPQAIPAFWSALVPIEVPPSTSLDVTLASPTSLVDYLSNAANSDAVSSTGPMAVSGGVAPPVPAAILGQVQRNAAETPAASSGFTMPDSAETINHDLADMVDQGDHSGDQGDFPLDGMPFNPFDIMGPAPYRGGSVANNTDDEPGMTFSGTLETIDDSDGLTMWMNAPQATGRASWHTWSLIITDPSLQLDSSGEASSASGLSYLAIWGSETLESPPSAAAVDDVLGQDNSSNDPVLPASITDGGVSLNILLGGPDVPIPPEPSGLEQVAELVPLPETSLALTATLWTVASQTPSSGPTSDVPSVAATDALERSSDPSSWAHFVTGMDQAIEQACRDIRDGISSTHGQEPGNPSSSSGSKDEFEWRGPILPAARTQSNAAEPGSPRPDRTYPGNLPRDRTVRSRENGAPRSGDRPGVALGAMPMLSIVSISTAIAGWFWKKRRQLTHRGRRASASQGSRKWTRSDEE